MLHMDVATLIHNREFSKIKPCIEAFRKKMHAKGIHAFDKELKSLEHENVGNNIGNNPRPNTKPKVVVTVNEGTKLMRTEKFKEAREWFRANSKKNGIEDCNTIIRWLRILRVYESEIDATAKTQNKEKARTRIKEINDIVDIYNKYGVDASQLIKLSNEYKLIIK